MHFKCSSAPFKVPDMQSTFLEALDVHELTTPQLASGNDGQRA